MDRPKHERLPRWVRWRWWLCGGIGAVGVFASLWTSAEIRELESRALRTSLRSDATERELVLRESLDFAVEAVHAVAAFRSASADVSEAQFSAFVGPLLARHPAIQAIGWDPIVRHADRRAHEEEARRGVYPEYRITERAVQGEMVPAAARPEYVVVRMIEPLAGNESALGFDVASEPSRLKALTLARRLGVLAITAPITLVQETESQSGVLAFLPYCRAGVSDTPESRRANTEGFHVAVVRVGDVVDAALGSFGAVGIDLRVYDVSSDDRQLLHERLSGQGARQAARDDAPETPSYVATVDLGGREWELAFTATPAYVRARRSAAPAGTLAAGLVITALVTAYLALLQRAFMARERAKRALGRSAERLRLTVDAVSDGAWDWNVVTDEVEFSDSWLAGLGYRREDVEASVGFWESIVHPEDLERTQALVRGHFDSETEVYECENRLRTRSGEYRWNLDRGRVVERGPGGEPLRMVGTDTDITERKRAEQERHDLEERVRHAQKLESLGVLAGGIAHDFNNLLVGVLGAADVALKQMPEGAPGRRQVERIKTAGSRASDLTSQMLAYAGGGRMLVERLDLAELVDEMADLLSASISKKADLRHESAGGDPLVAGDATQLRQVVMNLITNASDSLDGGSGSILVRTGVQDAGAEHMRSLDFGAQRPAGRYSFIEVADTGVGMTADVRKRMFDPFFSTKFQGRGLGLAAVLGIVSSHGGAIGIVTEPGRGTTIRILLPHAARADEAGSADVDPTPSQWRRSGIALVVDDEEGVREVARDLLESCGFRVLTAVDGLSGVQTFREHRDDIDVVVLDMAMPRMDGAEAFREIRRMRPDARVVFSSGLGDMESIPGLDDDRRVGFIRKPYLADDFIDRIRETVEN